MYSIQTICSAVQGRFLHEYANDAIDTLVYDSRRIQQPAAALFFALRTGHNDGHRYLADARKKGIRNFIISEESGAEGLEDMNVILVEDTLDALQDLASFHRDHFNIPIIGITGSNGKTIVKEWLYQLLQDDYVIVRSPKSFNSQIGVALSIWQMGEQHDLGIFEAGVSMAGEMPRLQTMIRPTIGVLTNIGDAHNEGFLDKDQKLTEKLALFTGAQTVIARGKDLGRRKEMMGSSIRVLTWGHAGQNDFLVQSAPVEKEGTSLTLTYSGQSYILTVPFTDTASIENAISCCCVLIFLGYDGEVLRNRMARLHPIDMRLQLNHSINDCLVINDSYSADITSLKIALDFLKQQGSGLKRTVILSEFFESGSSDKELYGAIADLLRNYGIGKAVLVGEKIVNAMQDELSPVMTVQAYASTDDFIRGFRSSQFFQEIILIKGARRFGFERIAQLFEKKLHQTVLEINLNALAHNLKEYQKQLQPETKVMAMVKAFSYGSGGAEIASVLQYHNAAYLGVAYADEGVDLVRSGITLPVMVMNAEASSFQAIVDAQLQPVIYSFDILHRFGHYLEEQGLLSYPVHIEIETGMNRLGFAPEEVEELAKHISAGPLFRICSVFTHLAASEDPDQDAFTALQGERFLEAVARIQDYIGYPFLRHIANSAAIIRHPGLQLDMVRLGIGLYGVEIDAGEVLDLQAVATLRSTIAQLHEVKKGDTISYNRRGTVDRDSLIATVRIGYADGYSRRFSNGQGKMWVRGRLVPVIGTVCMDMTMIDVTGLEGVKEGDEVVIFGPQLPVQEVSSWIQTIPYELMTGVSQRVKRIYFHE